MAERCPVVGTYPQPKHGWTCFHCGETFRTPGAARDHFGADPLADPACRIKAGEERGLLMALRKAEADRDALLAERQRLDEDAAQAYMARNEVLRAAKATSADQVRHKMDFIEGRAIAAEAIIAAIEKTHPALVEAARDAVCRGEAPPT